MARTLKDFASNFVKLECFDRGNFIRWQKRIYFLLVTLQVVYVLNSPKLVETENETIADTRKRQKWETNDEICKGYILNAMSDSLFDIYHSVLITKELWDRLEMKYIQEDVTNKKFFVSKFNNFKMVDGRPVMEQFANIKWRRLLLIILLMIFVLKRNFACRMRTKILIFLKCIWLKNDTLASPQTRGPMITHKIRARRKMANVFLCYKE